MNNRRYTSNLEGVLVVSVCSWSIRWEMFWLIVELRTWAKGVMRWEKLNWWKTCVSRHISQTRHSLGTVDEKDEEKEKRFPCHHVDLKERHWSKLVRHKRITFEVSFDFATLYRERRRSNFSVIRQGIECTEGINGQFAVIWLSLHNSLNERKSRWTECEKESTPTETTFDHEKISSCCLCHLKRLSTEFEWKKRTDKDLVIYHPTCVYMNRLESIWIPNDCWAHSIIIHPLREICFD